jgi:hypothetical protein
MRIEVNTPADYIQKSPEDRQPYLNKLWELIAENIPKEFSAGMSYGFPSFVVPLAVFPPGYHCKKEEPLPFISIANQKNFIALYHMGMYANPDLYAWFVEAYPKHAKKKLDMGKSCIRFKTMDDIPCDLIGELVQKMTSQQWIDSYEGSLKR